MINAEEHAKEEKVSKDFFIILLVSFLISDFPNQVIWSIPEPQWESGSELQVYKK